MMNVLMRTTASILAGVGLAACLCACSTTSANTTANSTENATFEVSDTAYNQSAQNTQNTAQANTETTNTSTAATPTADQLKAKLSLTEYMYSDFVHGVKTAEYQKYIVLHDTEGEGDGISVADYWESNGNLVAAHFVVNTDGTIVQCAPLDTIVHHAGFGDTGHNELYGVTDETRDDKLGTTSIGSWAADYGMNSYSIGIEMVHVGGSGSYPEAQLKAVDDLIAYIDAYYGFASQIIDHKAWRTGNSDTSDEFATYLANYQDHRTHN